MDGWTELRGKDLLIKVLKDTKGEEARSVKNGDAVLLDLEGWLCEGDEPPATELVETDDNDNKQIFQQAKSWLVLVGEKDLVEGVDIGLANMKEGQTVYIYCGDSKFGLGAESSTRKYQGCEVQAANSKVVYKATVAQIVQDTSRLNPYFALQKALTRKKIANDLYQFEYMILTSKEAAADQKNAPAKGRALQLYRQAGRDMKELLDGTYFASVESDHPQRKECRDLMMDSYNNVVVIYMHAKQYDKAIDAVELCLKRDAKNLKALVRNAKLHVLVANNEKKLTAADDALTRAEHAICYKDTSEETELKKIRAQYKQRCKQVSAA